MNRRSVLSLAGVAAVGAVVPFAIDQSSGIAQDTSDARLSSLETRVSVLETKVAGGISSPDSTQTVPSLQGTPTGPHSFVVSGNGSVVTENYLIPEGRYQVTLNVNSGCCITIDVFSPDGQSYSVTSNIFSGDKGGTMSFIYQFPQTAQYFFQASNTESTWSLSFEPR